jgi:peptidoglycan/LPS O-acetylase OafA/YrhL
MFGSYRLLLALVVALSHVCLTYRGFNPGQWSVVCFYVLSGFLMEKQFHKLAPSGGTRAFYLDRFLRIYPVYFAVTLLCAVFLPIDWLDTLINFTLLPLNYHSLTNIPILVDPAWSLACEAQFYLTVPFLALAPTRALRVLLTMSLLFFAVCVVLPDTGFWAYRGLPGIIFTFVSGMLISRREWPTLRVAYAFIAFLWLLFSSFKMLSIHLLTGIHINVCIGYLIAIPVTCYLSRLSPKVAVDQFFGLFSYPLFLVHMFVFELFSKHGAPPSVGPFLICSLLAAAALVLLVEKPSDILRYRLRKPGTGGSSGPNRI